VPATPSLQGASRCACARSAGALAFGRRHILGRAKSLPPRPTAHPGLPSPGRVLNQPASESSGRWTPPSPALPRGPLSVPGGTRAARRGWGILGGDQCHSGALLCSHQLFKVRSFPYIFILFFSLLFPGPGPHVYAAGSFHSCQCHSGALLQPPAFQGLPLPAAP